MLCLSTEQSTAADVQIISLPHALFRASCCGFTSFPSCRKSLLFWSLCVQTGLNQFSGHVHHVSGSVCACYILFWYSRSACMSRFLLAVRLQTVAMLFPAQPKINEKLVPYFLFFTLKVFDRHLKKNCSDLFQVVDKKHGLWIRSPAPLR